LVGYGDWNDGLLLLGDVCPEKRSDGVRVGKGNERREDHDQVCSMWWTSAVVFVGK